MGTGVCVRAHPWWVGGWVLVGKGVRGFQELERPAGERDENSSALRLRLGVGSLGNQVSGTFQLENGSGKQLV